jgi:hypothetical protein
LKAQKKKAAIVSSPKIRENPFAAEPPFGFIKQLPEGFKLCVLDSHQVCPDNSIILKEQSTLTITKDALLTLF